MPASSLQRLALPQAQLAVVDIQEKMLPHVAEHQAVLAQSLRMIRAAVEMQLPITVSEQYVRGLGLTLPSVLAACGDPPRCQRIEKTTFSLTGQDALRERIVGLQRPQVLLLGIETHVCVQQTALDLLDLGLQPIVLADAVGSRRPADRAVALERMRAAGVLITTVESAIFELLERAGTELFKRILPIVR
jgi:nicotinamidase-related amidase